MGGKPFKRLLLADALGTTPSSSNFRDLISSSYKYGLTLGSYKSSDISLTELGEDVTQHKDAQKRLTALRRAVMNPEVFQQFFSDFQDKKIPSDDMLGKILVAEYKVPEGSAEECAKFIVENGRFVGIIRDISGSPHVLFDTDFDLEESVPLVEESASNIEVEKQALGVAAPIEVSASQEVEQEKSGIAREEPEGQSAAKPIFIGHGKNRKPLDKLEKILSTFQIPFKVTIEEANLGRPIPQKVKETMNQCGSAILIFTRDEKFFDAEGNEIWRASENVVHELGAASFAYGDRIVIFKEKGIYFPTNYQSIGYIEFETENLDAKAMDLLKELIGFGLVRITPA